MSWSRQRSHSHIGKDTLQKLYFGEGLSLSSIAKETGTNYRLVRDSFKVHGMRWRSKAEARQGKTMPSEVREKISDTRSGWKDDPQVAAKKRAHLRSLPRWNKGLTADTDARMARLRDSVTKSMRTPQQRQRASIQKARQIQRGGYWDRGYYDSKKVGRIYYMSGWELRRWKELDADSDVIDFQRHPCRIPYTWEGNQHLYLPDVLISYTDGSKILEEIKPRRIVEDARRKRNKMSVKLSAGQEYAQQRGWGWRFASYDGPGGVLFTFN